uniref:Patched family protein n=1 Tax=Ditylenchus dipsaci TaxID=166011 RepID=A0A915ECK0_9BILA
MSVLGCVHCLCFRAMLNFEIKLTTRKLFPRDSPLLEIETYREEKILPDYSTAQLFINNPGNLSDPTRRSHLNHLIEEMESLPYAYNDPRSSMYFVRDLESFSAALHQLEIEEEGETPSNQTQVLNLDQDLKTFLDWPDYSHWRGLVKYHDENGTGTSPHIVLDSLMATVAYHGPQLTEWSERAHMLNDWRRVVDKYADEFNVTVLHDDGFHWQELVCMAALCILFFHSSMAGQAGAMSVFVAVSVIASIMIATMGLMQVQECRWILVDIPTHVAYHLTLGVVSSGVQERVKHSFDAVGWPAIQASMCTVVCVTCLLLAPVYIGIVFVRVMCLCIGLCALHSLVLLPAMFANTNQILEHELVVEHVTFLSRDRKAAANSAWTRMFGYSSDPPTAYKGPG